VCTHRGNLLEEEREQADAYRILLIVSSHINTSEVPAGFPGAFTVQIYGSAACRVRPRARRIHALVLSFCAFRGFQRPMVASAARRERLRLRHHVLNLIEPHRGRSGWAAALTKCRRGRRCVWGDLWHLCSLCAAG
jgi:hypothetical protein